MMPFDNESDLFRVLQACILRPQTKFISQLRHSRAQHIIDNICLFLLHKSNHKTVHLTLIFSDVQFMNPCLYAQFSMCE